MPGLLPFKDNKQGATKGGAFSYDRGLCFPLCLVNLFVMKPHRQQNRQVISYVPRVEPAPPEHAVKMDGFRDVWVLRNKYVAFVLVDEHFRRSPPFNVPEAAQRWAEQMRQEGEIDA
ncbi:cell division activator CedA [Klebsiella sp. RHBSTW-00484]|nr:cell division activator CedA [Klebsiella sp. RHBSTW-00465]QLO39876.1 cell division activator CedA [Klebsiella sp. RHBSTW-00484]QLT79395.1 cell division activator CedA [Klebsiella sp. RHBSTW-00464]